MTDIEIFKDMLTRNGVGFSTDADNQQIVVLTVDKEKVNGYCGFVCEFKFDPAGKLDEVGIWE